MQREENIWSLTKTSTLKRKGGREEGMVEGRKQATKEGRKEK